MHATSDAPARPLTDLRPAIAEPLDEYNRRLAARREVADRLDRTLRRLGDGRLAAIGAALLLGWLAYSGKASPVWMAAPLLTLLPLTFAISRSSRALQGAKRAVLYYESGLARLEDRWSGNGESGERFRHPAHPYAEDLDLFGVGSMFERLCAARTLGGQDRLAGWLLAPATPATLKARREAVEELRPRLDLREDLAGLGFEIPKSLDLEALAAWGKTPRQLGGFLPKAVAIVLVLATIASMVATFGFDALPGPMYACWLAELGFSAWYRRRVKSVIGPVEGVAGGLGFLSEIAGRLERETFQSPSLSDVGRSLGAGGDPASRSINRLRGMADRLAATHNVYFALIAPFLLWKTRIAFDVEGWRAANGGRIEGWIDVIAEVEALASIAGYSYECPADPFAEIEPEGPVIEAVGLGHPLLPAGRCIRNDLTIGGIAPTRVLVVSGSNMSGKSTWLRTVGVNVVLAQAGIPVRAERMRVSPLAVGATLRVQDSLQSGASRFYAEIQRIKQVVDLASGSIPLLFLLDEILHGTNSHDRRQGAEAIVRGLLGRGAIGLITTHDLALAEIAEGMAPSAINVHFADAFDGGTLHFDYTMRPGVVRESNALALMKSVGLEIGDQSAPTPSSAWNSDSK